MKTHFSIGWKGILLSILLILSLTTVYAQQDKFICDDRPIVFSPDSISAIDIFDSRYGLNFTPRDTFRVLVIFAGFANDDTSEHELFNDATWPWDSLGPGNIKNFLFYKNYSQFDSNATIKNVSNFYYQMSRRSAKPFKLVADYFPQRINVTATNTINALTQNSATIQTAWNIYTEMVFDTIQKYYPNFPWEKYDKRRNGPGFYFDNSDVITNTPETAVDFICVVWRYRKGVDPFETSPLDAYGGYAGITPHTFTKTNNDQYFITNGITVTTGILDTLTMTNLFIHELAHSIYHSPHYNGANDVVGEHFTTSTGWGMMRGDFHTYTLNANAWERWFNGWIDIKHDLSGYAQADTFILRDYLTTNDAMRIKLPYYENQYLWIENHQQESVFDQRTTFIRNGKNQIIPTAPQGILAYVENISSRRVDTNDVSHVNINISGANGIRTLSSSGNIEYGIGDTIHSQEWYNNIIHRFYTTSSNAIGPYASNSDLRYDLNNDNVISLTQETNSISR